MSMGLAASAVHLPVTHLSEEEWAERFDAVAADEHNALAVIAEMAECHETCQWSLGRAFALVETRYGEQTLLCMAKAAGVTYESARRWKETWAAFSLPEVRLQGISFTHHAVVARLRKEDGIMKEEEEWRLLAKDWLTLVIEKALTVTELEELIRKERGGFRDEQHQRGLERFVARHITDRDSAVTITALLLRRLRQLREDEEEVWGEARRRCSGG